MNIIRITFVLLLSVLVSYADKDADKDELLEVRLQQIKMLKTRQIKSWPQAPGALFQGLHYEFKKPIKNKKDHLAAIARIPKKLLKGYEPKKTFQRNGWYITDTGFSIIASKTGSNKLYFGYQW